MIIGIKTADRVAELILSNQEVIARDEWQADREMARGLLARIETLMHANSVSWDDLSGIVVYRGPGSFTGLRIGLTTANSIAYSLDLPIAGAQGDNWLQDGEARLRAHENDEMVLPEYGAEPRITSPRK